MPGGQTKFQEKWLENLDDNGDIIQSWCVKGKTDTDIYCILCKTNLSVSNGGFSQVLQHATRQKHIKASKLFKNQRTFSASSLSNKSEISNSNMSLALTADQSVSRAEAIWAIKVAISDFSFESCKDIVPLFNTMFENHPVASAMQIGERKISYVISHGLGPYFHNETVSDIKTAIDSGAFFTLSFDETTTMQIKKQLDIYIRYWSPKWNKIVCTYLTSLFFGHADAELICQNILNVLQTDKISVTNILMLGMDGPNVNLSVAKKMNQELKKLGSKDLVDINTCNLHKVHNCFSKALDELPLGVDEFATDLFSFFKMSAARREDLQNIQKLLEVEEKFLLRHVNSRWLTIGPVVKRILSVYDSLQEYFLKFIPKQKTSRTLQNNERYKRIVNALKNPETVVYLEFIASLTPHLESFLVTFQTEGPLIHLLYSEMNKLLRNILLKFLDGKYVGDLEGDKLAKLNIDNFENYKKLKNIDVGIGTKKAMLNLQENSSKAAKLALRSCLVKLAKSLQNSLPLSNTLLQKLEILHPLMRKVESNSIQYLCMYLKPLKLDNPATDKILMEWKTYSFDSEVQKLCDQFQSENQRIDLFWNYVFQLKEPLSGKIKYENLSNFVKNCLSLSHGNADVERGFSRNKNILTKNRLNMSESTIIGIRNVKEAVKKYGDILSIPMTPKLLHCVKKSYSVYIADKEAEAKAAEEEKKKRKCEAQAAENIEKVKKLKTEKEEKIKTLKNKVNFLQEELNSANKCLNENNEKLRDALEKKDFMTVRVVSNLIQSNTNEIQKTTEELFNVQTNITRLQSST